MVMPLEAGSLLEVRGERWLVTAAASHGACTVLSLEGRDRANARQRLSVIEPFERSKPIATRLTRKHRRAVLRAALSAIVDARAAGTLWTAATAAIDVWPYQLEPALAAINGATRLLLADAVGLGKTVQAGLLLSELRERGWIERALIVCPAGLRDTWARELDSRFGISAEVLDQGSVADRVATLPPGINPWSGRRISIASIDFIKRPEVLSAIEAEPIDLLIADEAHHLTPGTDRGAAIARLADRATWCVLMSATPHSGDDAAFTFLTAIGAHDDPLAIFHRNRTDVGLSSKRRTHRLAVTPTNAEVALFEGIDRYARAMWRERGRAEHAVRLIAITLSRRAASSAAAILKTLMRRHALLGSLSLQPIQPLLPWDEEDAADDVEDEVLLATPGLHDSTRERAVVATLIELARLCVDGSKIRRLVRILNRIREPVVVFTEYRDTLDTIVDRVRASRSVAAIHGGMPAALRRSAVDAFNEGRIDLLVATDAAGEGLNLHHRSRLVIDMELPWNPLRLEQRVGRVDRLGQRRTVHAIRLFHAGTIEAQVLEHLERRSRKAATAFDQSGVTERAIAEAIFSARPVVTNQAMPIETSHVAAAAGEAARILEQRRAHLADAPAGTTAWCTPRRRRPTRFVLVGRRCLINESGCTVSESIEAYHAILPPAETPREWRRVIQTAWNAASSREELTATVPNESVDRRICRIREHLARLRVEHQRSLFDRRDEADRLAGEQSMARRLDALSRTQSAIGPPTVDRSHVDLVAAWPETHR